MGINHYKLLATSGYRSFMYLFAEAINQTQTLLIYAAVQLSWNDS